MYMCINSTYYDDTAYYNCKPGYFFEIPYYLSLLIRKLLVENNDVI